ncbi:MAG: hypothetical protein ACR2M9_01540 [Cyanophyceae cyanobacterium]
MTTRSQRDAQRERMARLRVDLWMAMNYEDFLVSLKDWAESSIIVSVKPLVSIVSQLNYAEKGTTYDSKLKQRNYMQGVRTWKNVQKLFNRKLTPFYNLGLPENWMEPSIYQDLIGHFDEDTKFMFDRHSEQYKANKGYPVPSNSSQLDTHPLERYGEFETGWVDANGKSIQDYKDEATRDLLDAVENNKDSDYVNKSASAYLTAKMYHLPFLNTVSGSPAPKDTTIKYGWDYLINEWTPLFTKQIRQELNPLWAESSLAIEKLDTIYQPLYDQIKEQEEILDLDDLLEEMSYLLEVFNLYEPVLKLNHFEIISVYADDGIDEEGMEELWKDAIRDNLSGDELERYDNDEYDFIDNEGYDINDYISDFSWDSPELSRHHNNQVKWKWNKNADMEIPDLTDTIEIDGEQMSNFAYMPSPFTKQYNFLSYDLGNNSSQIKHFTEPTNELIGMRWGDYAWPNIYSHQTQIVNENPSTISSPFIPFNLPLDIRRLRYLAGRPITQSGSKPPKFVEDFDFSEPSITANITGGYGDLVVNLNGERRKPHEPIIPGVDVDKYGTSIPGTEPKIPKFEQESMGLHHFDIKIIVNFIAQAPPIINYMLNKPKISRKSSTN